MASQIAAALKAEKLVLMTDVPGVLRDKNDIGTKIQALDIRSCRELIQDGVIAGGMIPKVRMRRCEDRCNCMVRDRGSPVAWIANGPVGGRRVAAGRRGLHTMAGGLLGQAGTPELRMFTPRSSYTDSSACECQSTKKAAQRAFRCTTCCRGWHPWSGRP